MSRACALVTGASRGIGAAIACALAAEGFDLALNYATSQPAASRVAASCEVHGIQSLLVQADISDKFSRQRMIDEIRRRFGRLDVLVNNAGIAPEKREDILDLSEQSYERVMSVNLTGSFRLTQLVARWMQQQRTEDADRPLTIINITSISSFTASPDRAAYCVSKAGLSMITKLFADRLASEGILVYEIQPGIIRTDMTSSVEKKYDQFIEGGGLPVPRWGEPEDVGKAVAMIAKRSLPYSTGEVIRVDGGFHLRRLH